MAVLAAMLAWGAVAHCAPALQLEPAEFTWESQAENKGAYDFAFTVTNTGDEDLQITNVRPGCPSCTKLTMAQRTLKPGESTRMTGTLTTADVEGPMHRVIYLSSNDPARPVAKAGLSIRLPFQAQGLRLKGMAPPVQVRRGVYRTTVIVENCEAETPVNVTAIELPEGWSCERPLPVTVPAEGRVTLVLRGGALTGSDGGAAFTLISDSTKTPRLQGSLAVRGSNAQRPASPGTPFGRPRRRPAEPAAETAPTAPAAPAAEGAAPVAPATPATPAAEGAPPAVPAAPAAPAAP